MGWLSMAALIALLVGLGAGAWLSAKIGKGYWQRKSEKRLTKVKAEYARQMAKMQEIYQDEQQNQKAVQAAETTEEVSNALDGIYNNFDSRN